MIKDMRALEPIRILLESYIMQAGGDRLNEDWRRRALAWALQSRPDMTISDELRRKLLDPDFTSDVPKTLGFSEPEIYGPDIEKIRAAGSKEIFTEMTKLAADEGEAIDSRNFYHYKWKTWQKHPELKPKLDTAKTLSEACDAVALEKPHLDPAAVARMVANERPQLLSEEYGRRASDVPEQFSDDQVSESEAVRDDLALTFAEATSWAEGIGLIRDPHDYRERQRALSAYAQTHPKRIPASLREYFRCQRGVA